MPEWRNERKAEWRNESRISWREKRQYIGLTYKSAQHPHLTGICRTVAAWRSRSQPTGGDASKETGMDDLIPHMWYDGYVPSGDLSTSQCIVLGPILPLPLACFCSFLNSRFVLRKSDPPSQFSIH
jgi:hypothetical protein